MITGIPSYSTFRKYVTVFVFLGCVSVHWHASKRRSQTETFSAALSRTDSRENKTLHSNYDIRKSYRLITVIENKG